MEALQQPIPGPAGPPQTDLGGPSFRRAGGSVTLDRCSKSYGELEVLTDVSLEVASGEFLTLLGPSGSGKTTLLMMIAGFVEPSSGEIAVNGRQITGLPPEKRNFGMVFQGYALFPHMTVAENIAYPLRVRGVRKAEMAAKVADALALVRLEKLGERYPRQLSGGQQQRVAIARSLVFSPDVLLFDEPLGALDRKLRVEVQLELKALHDRLGATFIYVTHDQEEAMTMSDRVVIIDRGQISQIGAPAEIYERPANRFAANFLGKSNLINGRLVARNGGTFEIAVAGGSLFHRGEVHVDHDQQVTLMLRPEKVGVSALEPDAMPNRTQGIVRSIAYLGPTFEVELDTPIGAMLATCFACQAPPGIGPGASVWIGWSSDATVSLTALITDFPLPSRAPTLKEIAMHSRITTDLIEIASDRLAKGEIDRRAFLGALAALGVAPSFFAAGEAKAAAGEIVLVSFGGDAVPTWSAAFGEPYAADSGTKVSVIGAEPTAGAIKAMVESGTVTWDIADGDAFYLPILGDQKLIQPYDYTKVDKTKVRPEFVFEHGCSIFLYSTVNGYNVEKTGGKIPNGYKDYLNFKDFPGKRAMYKWLVGSIEAVLIGYGVEPKDLYPLDVERAFALIREHKDEFLLWGGGAASQQLFRDGEVVMGPIWNTRASVLDRESDGKLTWTWDHGIIAPGVWPVLVNNPAGPEVFDFLASTQKPERQVELLKTLGNGPANPAAAALLTPELQKIDCGYQPNYDRQILINTQWYVENYEKVQNDFLDLIAS